MGVRGDPDVPDKRRGNCLACSLMERGMDQSNRAGACSPVLLAIQKNEVDKNKQTPDMEQCQLAQPNETSDVGQLTQTSDVGQLTQTSESPNYKPHPPSHYLCCFLMRLPTRSQVVRHHTITSCLAAWKPRHLFLCF
jgi:hypothetical protein